MSIDKALEFLDRIEREEELAREADDAFVAGLHAVARRAGYDFGEDVLREGMDAAARRPLPEGLEELETLSDEDVDGVVAAGGTLAGLRGDTPFGGVSGVTYWSGGETGNTVSIAGSRFASFSKSGFSKG